MTHFEDVRQAQRQAMARRLMPDWWPGPPPDHWNDIVCGTDAGYQKHLRNGEETCKPCRKAHRLVVYRNRANG